MNTIEIVLAGQKNGSEKITYHSFRLYKNTVDITNQNIINNSFSTEEITLLLPFGELCKGLNLVKINNNHQHILTASDELYHFIELINEEKIMEALRQMEIMIKPLEDEIISMKPLSKFSNIGLYFSTLQYCFGLIFTQNGNYNLLTGTYKTLDNHKFIIGLINYLTCKYILIDGIKLSNSMIHKLLQIILIQCISRQNIINFFGNPNRTIKNWSDIDDGFLFDMIQLWYNPSYSIQYIQSLCFNLM
jgi:hypothetical protein